MGNDIEKLVVGWDEIPAIPEQNMLGFYPSLCDLNRARRDIRTNEPLAQYRQ
jgi:hypothetical protein